MDQWRERRREQIMRDVVDTVLAHCNDGNGRCAGPDHGEFRIPGEDPPPRPMFPCAIRAHFQLVIAELQRQGRM